MASAPDSVSLEVRGLVKRYGTREAVRGVSFQVRRGTVFGLLGPNGAGKTSVVECLLGLRQPDGGNMLVEGIDVAREPEAAKRQTGAALQATALPERMTPREALAMFGAFYPERFSVEESLQSFGLTEQADTAYGTLSGGQRQRLALALACIHRPTVLCLDEPTVGLDAQARRDLHGLIRRWRDQGGTVLLTTHYTEEAHALCDEVAVLRNGQIVAQGPPAQLIARSRARPVLVVRARAALNPTSLRELPEIVTVEMTGDAATLSVTEVGAAVVSLVGLLKVEGNELTDLRVAQPSLEDTLIELTDAGKEPQP